MVQRKTRKKKKIIQTLWQRKIPKINIYHTDTITKRYDWMRLTDSPEGIVIMVMLKLWMLLII